MKRRSFLVLFPALLAVPVVSKAEKQPDIISSMNWPSSEEVSQRLGTILSGANAQNMYNFWIDSEVEVITLAPKAPWIGEVK